MAVDGSTRILLAVNFTDTNGNKRVRLFIKNYECRELKNYYIYNRLFPSYHNYYPVVQVFNNKRIFLAWISDYYGNNDFYRVAFATSKGITEV